MRGLVSVILLSGFALAGCSSIPQYQHTPPAGPSASLNFTTDSPIKTQIHILGDSQCNGAARWLSLDQKKSQEEVTVSSSGELFLMLTGLRLAEPNGVQTCSVMVALEMDPGQHYRLDYTFREGPCQIQLYQRSDDEMITKKFRTPSSIMTSRQCQKVARSVKLDRRQAARLLP